MTENFKKYRKINRYFLDIIGHFKSTKHKPFSKLKREIFRNVH